MPGSIQNSALNKSWTKQVIQRLEETTDQFRSSFDAGLDRSRIDGSSYEDFMNSVMAQFERSVDKLEDDANSSKQLDSTDITLALTSAATIQAIHIIVDGGRATLKGIVDTQADRDQAYIRARGVPGLLAVTNELIVKDESLIR